MAITTLTPYSTPGDLMNLKEVCELLRETGHPYSKSQVRRWIERDGLPVEREKGGEVLVSFSDILMSHQEAVTRSRR